MSSFPSFANLSRPGKKKELKTRKTQKHKRTSGSGERSQEPQPRHAHPVPRRARPQQRLERGQEPTVQVGVERRRRGSPGRFRPRELRWQRLERHCCTRRPRCP